VAAGADDVLKLIALEEELAANAPNAQARA